jgi:hypothetical protein
MRITGLPFPFEVTGDVSRGAQATLRIELNVGASAEGFGDLQYGVECFSELGTWGALGGAVLRPDQVEARLNGHEPAFGDTIPTWTFLALAIEPAACTILANLIYATGLPVCSVHLETSGSTDPATRGCDDYPEEWPQISFEVEANLTDRNVQIMLDFAADLPEDSHDRVCGAVHHWLMVAALGGFRNPGPLRERFDLLPEGEPEIVLDQLTVNVRDDGMHEAAYGILVNLCAGMRARGVPIVRLELE